MEGFFLLFKTIAFLLAIIFLIRISLTYLNKHTQNQSKSIEIVERLSVGKESSLSIVLVCKKYYLMSMTPTSNELIKELDEEEVRDLVTQKHLEQKIREKKQQQVLNHVPDFFKILSKSKKEG